MVIRENTQIWLGVVGVVSERVLDTTQDALFRAPAGVYDVLRRPSPHRRGAQPTHFYGSTMTVADQMMQSFAEKRGGSK